MSELENNHTYESTIDVTKKMKMDLEFGVYLREPLSRCRKKIDIYKVNHMYYIIFIGNRYPEFNPDDGLIEFM